RRRRRRPHELALFSPPLPGWGGGLGWACGRGGREVRARKFDDPPRFAIPVAVAVVRGGRLGLDRLQQFVDQPPSLNRVQGVIPARRQRLKDPREGVARRVLSLGGGGEEVVGEGAEYGY